MTKEQKILLAKKLEYTFKHSDLGKELVIKLNENKPITPSEKELLLRKLEYRFKNSENGKSFITELTK